MLPGFNHNIRYKNRVYHIQTEDAGAHSAHISTTVFYGGTVIAMSKASYAELVGHADLSDQVISLMQNNHKAMLRDLVQGVHDAAIQARTEPRGSGFSSLAPLLTQPPSHSSSTSTKKKPKKPAR